jgi:hypothetical protein
MKPKTTGKGKAEEKQEEKEEETKGIELLSGIEIGQSVLDKLIYRAGAKLYLEQLERNCHKFAINKTMSLFEKVGEYMNVNKDFTRDTDFAVKELEPAPSIIDNHATTRVRTKVVQEIKKKQITEENTTLVRKGTISKQSRKSRISVVNKLAVKKDDKTTSMIEPMVLLYSVKS